MNSIQKLTIIDQGNDWLVINKPEGLTVHNDPNDVLHILRRQMDLPSNQELHLIHRLDKETSGLLLLSLNSKSASSLAAQFQERQTEKIYRAVLRGALPQSDNQLEWTFPITDKAEGRKNPQGLSKDRVEAKTLFKVINNNSYFSLVEVQLLTGRQHQIRKHSALAKHAIVGDPRYGDPKYNEKMAKIYGTSRMFLHAQRLTIVIDGVKKTFESETPPEFIKILP